MVIRVRCSCGKKLQVEEEKQGGSKESRNDLQVSE
jgi:hypothetical protein